MMKKPHVYGWDEEPIDERPSEFMESVLHSGLSGFHPANDPLRVRRSRSRFGFKSMLAFCLALVVLGTFALAQLVKSLSG